MVNRDFLIWRKDGLSSRRLKSLCRFLHAYAAQLKENTLLRLQENQEA